MRDLIDKLKETTSLSKKEWITLIEHRTEALADYLFAEARSVREQHYGTDIYVRGLIEFTNYCKNDCYYCGIRKSNLCATRYRLSDEDIFACCEEGYALGFRTFVLQGGEDGFFTDTKLSKIISEIKRRYPDCAITLSVGEKEHDSYQMLFDAGADRYLLRHETCNQNHYRMLHPASLSASHRQQCLYDLKAIGYQVGTGFMVGAPYQTAEHLAEDMLFIQKLNPHMVGIGPFLPHHETPFRNEPAGSMELTLFMLGLLRLMLPKVLLPATTALGTADANGQELGILAGANVIMPNLSPRMVRDHYMLYDNKVHSGDEAAENLTHLQQRMQQIGYQIVTARGDSLNTL